MIAAEVNKVMMSTRGMSESQRKAYMKKHENTWWISSPQLRTLTFRQGKMLIKLVDRECNKTSYDLIKEYRVRSVPFSGRALPVCWCRPQFIL